MKQKEKVRKIKQVKNIIITGIFMSLGLIILKFIPQLIFGEEILFDASGHLVLVSFILYIGYFFIDQKKNFRPIYFLFCLSVLTIVSLQRILVNAHNDIGLLLGLFIVITSIIITNWKKIRGDIDF